MKKLKVLYVDFSVGFGGSAVSLKNLAKGIAALGHQVVVAFTFHRTSAFQENKLFPAEVKVISLRGPMTDIFLSISRCLYDRPILVKVKITAVLMFFIKIVLDRIPTIFKLSRVIRNTKADVVHINNGISIPIIKAAELAKAPCLVSLRSFVSKEMATRSILKRTDYFIANSQAVKRDFVAKSGIADDKVKVVYNGVNMEEIKAKASAGKSKIITSLGIKSGQKLIGTAGRLIEWKRQDLLILAVEKMVKAGIELKCLIIGAPEKELASQNYENRLRSLTKEKNLDQQVIFTGFIENPLEIMKELDVFVLPSMTEPFGNVVLESMVLGVPVVAFNEGGPLEIITHGKDGMLVPSGNVDALADATSRLLMDRTFHQTLSANAVQKVKDQFSLAKSIEQLDALYREVVAKKS